MSFIIYIFFLFCFIFSFNTYSHLEKYIGDDAILFGWLQENAAYGKVKSVPSEGLVQSSLYLEQASSDIIRKEENGGIFFPSHNLSLLRTKYGHRDVPRILRAGSAIFALHPTKDSSKTTYIYGFNRSQNMRMRGEGKNISLAYNAEKKALIATFNHVRDNNGILKTIMFSTKRNIHLDGRPNIFAWRRYNGILHIFFNNQYFTLKDDISWSHPIPLEANKELFHSLGHVKGDDLTIDSVMFIQKELSSLQWHNFLIWLYQRPFVMAHKTLVFKENKALTKNINRVYMHDQKDFFDYEKYSKDKVSETQINMGKSSVYNNTDFQIIMKDDFKQNRLTSSFKNNIDYAIWSAPNLNNTIEMAAKTTNPNSNIDKKLHIYDYSHGSLRLGMKYDGHKHYYAGTISTVDQDGAGRYHGGTRRYYLKSRSPKKQYDPDNPKDNELAQAYFPAFWGYGIDHLRNRAAPRVEIDWFEWHGNNPYWGNIFTNHVHAPALMGRHKHSDGKAVKILGALLNEEKTGIKGGINRWNGKIQEHAITIDEDSGYVYIDYRDERTKEMDSSKTNKGWIELVRSKIHPHHLLPFYTILNHAMKPYGLKPHELEAYKDAKSIDKKENIIHDYFELLSFKVAYKPKHLGAISKGFKFIPFISGEIKANHKIQCIAEAISAEILLYDWYKKDGTPLALTNHNNFTIPQNFDTKGIYCKAYSHDDQKYGYIEAYSQTHQ